MPSLSSLTIFFPFYNDQETVLSSISTAYSVGRRLTKDLEVIAIHGGASTDQTAKEINKAKKRFPNLVVLDHSDNSIGYAVIKHGFQQASKEWIFYTDGDEQYSCEELTKLVAMQNRTEADFVNGYKRYRQDSWSRKFYGDVFKYLYRALLKPPIRDIHCDFRLIRAIYIKNIHFQRTGSGIISELVFKTAALHPKIVEISVSHRRRKYGKSNYSLLRLATQSSREIFWALRYKIGAL